MEYYIVHYNTIEYPPTPADGKGERVREAIASSKGQQQQMARSKQQEARKATALEVEKENTRCKGKQATEQEARSENAKKQGVAAANRQEPGQASNRARTRSKSANYHEWQQLRKTREARKAAALEARV